MNKLPDEVRERSRKATLAEKDTSNGLWIFGYGSLMWNPEFTHVEKIPGVLKDYHRNFCILAIITRGTPEQPGLSLGLKNGGETQGIVFKIGPEQIEEVTYNLWKREMITGVLMPTWGKVKSENREVDALVFVANQEHSRYVDYDLETSASLIRTATGKNGSCLDYLVNTVEQLEEHGFEEPYLKELLACTIG